MSPTFVTRGVQWMNCSQCGAEAPVGAAFCSQCGAKLDSAGVAPNPGAARLSADGSPRDNTPEQDLWTGSYSPKAMTASFVGAALLTIVAIIAVSFAGGVWWLAVVIGAALLFAY